MKNEKQKQNKTQNKTGGVPNPQPEKQNDFEVVESIIKQIEIQRGSPLSSHDKEVFRQSVMTHLLKVRRSPNSN